MSYHRHPYRTAAQRAADEGAMRLLLWSFAGIPGAPCPDPFCEDGQHRFGGEGPFGTDIFAPCPTCDGRGEVDTREEDEE